MITGVVAFIFLISVQYLIIVYDDIFEKDVILGNGLNPPGVVIIAYVFIGKHTLYIFLYHLLFVSILHRFINGWNVWVKMPIYYIILC